MIMIFDSIVLCCNRNTGYHFFKVNQQGTSAKTDDVALLVQEQEYYGKVNTIVADSLVPCVAMTSVDTILNIAE